HLVGEADADVPGVVILVVDAVREGRHAVERIAGAEPLAAELTGHVPAERTERELLRRGVLDRAGGVVAPGAGVEEIRRIVFVGAEREVADRVGHLAVDFVEAGDRLGDVAVRDGRGTRGVTGVTGAAGIIIIPKADIERDRAEGRTHAAVEVDLRRGVVGELDALAGDAGIELPVRVDVVARLEIRRDGRLVAGLGDAAPDVIVHDRRAEGDVPRRRRR